MGSLHCLCPMRIRIGDIPASATPASGTEGWTRIVSPSSCAVHLWTWITGLALVTGLLTVIIVASFLAPVPRGNSQLDQPVPRVSVPPGDAQVGQPTPWLVILLTLVLAVPAHELVHALVHPGGVFSPATVFVVWPQKLRFGVYFEGSMSRRRWLVMRLAPLAILAVAPALLLLATAGLPRSLALETALALLSLVNSLGSGSDVLAAAWVAYKIPSGSALAFMDGKAYWKPGLASTT